MLAIAWKDALENLDRGDSRLIKRADPRHRQFGVFPDLHPRFRLGRGSKVFTIGSCFARHLEEKLDGFDLPTRRFSVPPNEWPNRPNGLLNEYNPGTMRQRITYALEGRTFGDRSIVGENEALDLLIVALAGVPRERALARRAEIDAVYREMRSSDAVIITLGMVEAWFDNETNLYLNRMPPRDFFEASGSRYEFRVLDVEEALALLESGLAALVDAGHGKILLTVSPVPFGATFSGQSCTLANTFSKSALRVCADRLIRRFPQVDYFPSYEIVMSGGLSNFWDDNQHVLDPVVDEVVAHMTSAYVI